MTPESYAIVTNCHKFDLRPRAEIRKIKNQLGSFDQFSTGWRIYTQRKTAAIFTMQQTAISLWICYLNDLQEN